MLILTLRTDKPEAEIALYQDSERLAYEIWEAHRQLAETIHIKIRQLLENAGKDWPDIQGIVCFQGPGSFTGLRIGAAVVNALASGNNVSIVGSVEKDWIALGTKRLLSGQNDLAVNPYYGAEPNITKPVK